MIGPNKAGRSAAHRLSQYGWRVTVLESNSNRVGGRVFSTGFNESAHEGLVCELGGEWIGDDHSQMKRLCREFDLWPLKQHGFASMFWPPLTRTSAKRFSPGRWPFSKRAKRGFMRLKRQFKANQSSRPKMVNLDQNDWWTVLSRNGFSMRELARRDLMDSTDFGESIRLSSAYLAATEYFDSNDTDEMDFKIEGGNDLLPQRMATRIGRRHELRLDATVRRVEQGIDGVEVFIDGCKRSFRGDFCICTVPAHCLLHIKWKPNLHPAQIDAARQLQYSRIMKTAVLYSQRFWDSPRRSAKAGFSVFTTRASDFCFDSTFGQPGTMGILCSYAIGDKADDLAAEQNPNNLMKWITEDVVSVVQPKRGVVIAPINTVSQPWQREKDIGGAYAFYRPGQWFTVRGALATPHQSRGVCRRAPIGRMARVHGRCGRNSGGGCEAPQCCEVIVRSNMPSLRAPGPEQITTPRAARSWGRRPSRTRGSSRPIVVVGWFHEGMANRAWLFVHSARSTSTGLRRVARRAGTTAAVTVTVKRAATAVTNDTASAPRTPYSSVSKVCARTRASNDPHAEPGIPAASV